MIRYVVSGVGRSGTTALYDMISSCLQESEDDWSFCYEPYLWGPNTWNKSPKNFVDEFSITDSLYPRGIATHKETDLFTEILDEGHEFFLNGLSRLENNVLIKFIRVSGRLEALLDFDPKIRIVHIMRNPLEVVNSAGILFSFFGDEFHPSDKKRFRAETEKRWAGRLAGDNLQQVEWNVNWWYFMNLAALESAQRYPDNILLVSQEALRIEPTESLRRVLAFLNVAVDEERLPEKRGHGYSVGNRIGLSGKEIKMVKPFLAKYASEFLPYNATADLLDWPMMAEQLEEKFGKVSSEGNLQQRIDFPCNGTIVAARKEILKQQTNIKKIVQQNENFEKDAVTSFDRLQKLRSTYIERRKTQNVLLGKMQATSGSLMQSRLVKALGPFSGKLQQTINNTHQLALQLTEAVNITCVVTCYNNASTIRQAVHSVLGQTIPVKEIIIADDCSTDKSREVAHALSAQFPNVRLICRNHNVGPGLNRHLAFLEADAPFVTQLDGDDELAPEKIQAEWTVLRGRLDCVAFSDVLLRRVTERIERQETFWFHQLSNVSERVRGMFTRSGFLPHNMLYSKDLYLRVGGYDTSAKMYEDWSLKLRLAKTCDRWEHSGTDGLIYNLHDEGLSSAPKAIHHFWIIYCIVKNYRLLIESVGVSVVKNYIVHLIQNAVWFGGRNEFVQNLEQILASPQAVSHLYAALSPVLTTCPPAEFYEAQEFFRGVNAALLKEM